MEDKEIREYYCCYCDKHYEDSNWTYDHIIPLVLGGINKYMITSCYNCNNKIGREIEQQCAQSVDFRQAIIQLFKSGFKLRSRRKKSFIPYSRHVGISPEGYFKWWYNVKTNQSELKLFGKSKRLDSFFVSQGEKKKKFVIPLEKLSEREKIAISSIMYKITLASGYQYFGESFSSESVSKILRDNMWKKSNECILKAESSPGLIVVNESDGENSNTRTVHGKDNSLHHFSAITDFNNPPHHTIAIIKQENSFLAVVNFYGMFEYSWVIYDNKISLAPEVNSFSSGVVIVVNFHENKIKSFSSNEYTNNMADIEHAVCEHGHFKQHFHLPKPHLWD